MAIDERVLIIKENINKCIINNTQQVLTKAQFSYLRATTAESGTVLRNSRSRTPEALTRRVGGVVRTDLFQCGRCGTKAIICTLASGARVWFLRMCVITKHAYNTGDNSSNSYSYSLKRIKNEARSFIAFQPTRRLVVQKEVSLVILFNTPTKAHVIIDVSEEVIVSSFHITRHSI